MPSRPRFSKIRKTWSFHVVVRQRTATKCTKSYNARAQLLFCSLNLLFGDVPLAVAVVVCLSSQFLIVPTDREHGAVIWAVTKARFKRHAILESTSLDQLIENQIVRRENQFLFSGAITFGCFAQFENASPLLPPT